MIGIKASDSKKGFKEEINFEWSVQKAKQLFKEIYKSLEREDYYEHIDFFLRKLTGEKIAVDVKNNSYHLRDKENTIGHWVELYNNYGNKGWLNGNADYIVFTNKKLDEYLFVPREELRQLLKDTLEEEPIIHPTETKVVPYKVYTRQTKRDAFLFVPEADMRKLNCFSIKRYIDGRG